MSLPVRVRHRRVIRSACCIVTADDSRRRASNERPHRNVDVVAVVFIFFLVVGRPLLFLRVGVVRRIRTRNQGCSHSGRMEEGLVDVLVSRCGAEKTHTGCAGLGWDALVTVTQCISMESLTR